MRQIAQDGIFAVFDGPSLGIQHARRLAADEGRSKLSPVALIGWVDHAVVNSDHGHSRL